MLLWLWRVLPLSEGVQWLLLRVLNTSFLVGVVAIAFDEHDRVLLLHHTYRNTFPWGLPGGWLEAGEAPADGALRELVEETGFQAAVEDLVWVHHDPTRPKLDLAYRVRILGGAFRPSAEIDRHRFFGSDALPDLPPFQHEIIAAARRSRREGNPSQPSAAR